MRGLDPHITLLTCLAVFSFMGCRDSVQTAAADGPEEGMEPVPARTVLADDPRLTRHQDTLYLDAARFDGRLLELHPNGDTASLTGHLQGLEEGLSAKWYPDGRPAETRTYHRGRKVGWHRGWWQNGNPRFEYRFSKGEHDGVMREWYENGRPYKVFHYREGHEEGSQRLWWENGTVRANYVVKDGRRYGLIGLKLCSNPDKDSAQ